MKRRTLKLLLIGLTVLLFGCKKKPNIIFIITDDMYPNMFNNLAEGVSKGGTPKNLTPSLDRLIKEGVWLSNIKVVSPVCTPSRYNCLTGNFASRAINRGFLNNSKKNEGQPLIQWNSFIVPGKQNTMGTYFQNIGYKTGFVGKNHVIESTSQIGESAKPDLNAKPRDPEIKKGLEYRYNELQKDIKNCGFDYADGLYHNNPKWLGIKALAVHNMDWITEKGLDFIENNKEDPFLLYFATTLPHGPTNKKQSWMADRRITPRGILDKAPEVFPQIQGKLPKKYENDIAEDPGMESSIRNFISLNKRIKKANLTGKSKENILWLDDALTALFKKLEETDLLDNTIIVFFNDHGQELKGTLYEGGINSQAIIWKKGGFKVGNVLQVPVSNIDFLPTLLDIIGDTENLGAFDGFSFKNALNNEEYKEKSTMYYELGYAKAVVKNNFKYYAIRYPKWAKNLSFEERKELLDAHNKYNKKFGNPIITNDPMAPFGHLVMVPGGEMPDNHAMKLIPNYSDMDQLYDLKNDPQEKHNLINDPKYKELIEELKKELRDQIEKLPGHFDV